MLALTSCPECHAPAEITERFTLASTDGPIAHVAISCLGGHHYRMPADKLPGASTRRPALRLALLPLRLTLLPLRLALSPFRLALSPFRPAQSPHRFQLCAHCQVNPAGFWVSGSQSTVVRRPWCLSCCDDLDRATCHVTPFTS